MSLNYNLIFFFRPSFFLDIWIQVIVPSLKKKIK
jgi:hypothetical protein